MREADIRARSLLATRHRANKAESSLAAHFSAVAEHYRELRDLDCGTARRVAHALAELAAGPTTLRVLDVGAGTGRYTEAVIKIAAAEDDVVCHGVVYDANQTMVASSAAFAQEEQVRFSRAVGLAEALPFREGAFDAVLSLNAVHHFGLDAFLQESARVLRAAGLLIVYTRTPEQNRRTIWGQLFPTGDNSSRSSRSARRGSTPRTSWTRP